jgi:hypothetical protein
MAVRSMRRLVKNTAHLWACRLGRPSHRGARQAYVPCNAIARQGRVPSTGGCPTSVAVSGVPIEPTPSTAVTWASHPPQVAAVVPAPVDPSERSKLNTTS